MRKLIICPIWKRERKYEAKGLCDYCYRMQWKLKNKDKVRISNKKYRKENEEKVKIIKKRWAEKNPDKMRIISKRHCEKNKDRKRILQKRWNEENPNKIKMYSIMSNHKRRLRENFNKPDLKLALFHNFLKFGAHFCEKCGGFIGMPDSFFGHIDHIIPFSKGGNGNYDNLQILCKECNLTKYNKIEDWRQNDKYY